MYNVVYHEQCVQPLLTANKPTCGHSAKDGCVYALNTKTKNQETFIMCVMNKLLC